MDRTNRQTLSSRPAIVIACGGSGSRIGGDKPLRELAGRPMHLHMRDWALAHSDLVALAARTTAQVSDGGLPLLLDQQCDIGPIAALASAFDFAHSAGREFVLLIGCDQPFLPADLIARLFAAVGTGGAAMPLSGGSEQPLATLWRVDRAALSAYLSEGGQSLRRFARRVGVAVVEWPASDGIDPFFNINDPAALAVAERWIRSAAR